MLLAIDTATRVASIALWNAQGVQAEVSWRSRENHTVELMVEIARMLDRAHVATLELSAVGVALGPGSFTGLRVGMSVAKGLAFGLAIPVLGVPTLDAVAIVHSLQALPIWAIIAAGRGRYSLARYAARRGAVRRVGDYALVTVAGLADLAERECAQAKNKRATRALFCGEVDPALEELLRGRLGTRAVIAPPAMNVRRAGFIAQLAWARFQAGQADDTGSLAPMYMPHASVEGTSQASQTTNS